MRWLDRGVRLLGARVALIGLVAAWLVIAVLALTGFLEPPALMIVAPIVFAPIAAVLATRMPWRWTGAIAVVLSAASLFVAVCVVVTVRHRVGDACVANTNRPSDPAYASSRVAGVNLLSGTAVCAYSAPGRPDRLSAVRLMPLARMR